MKENYNSFCDKVCSYIDYATGKEIEGVRKELCDHLDDHAQALIDIGRSPEEAEVAAILAMGDPEDIGREMNMQFPFVWLLLSRASAILAVLLIICLISPLINQLGLNLDNIRYRTSPISCTTYKYTHQIDHRIEIPHTNDIAYFYAYALEYDEKQNQHYAVLGLVTYDKNVFGIVSNYSHEFSFLIDDMELRCGGGGMIRASGAQFRYEVPVSKGQENVIAVYEHLGERIELEIPLSWEGEDE